MQEHDTKRCQKCKTPRPVGAFNRKARERDGLSDWCRECTAAYRASHYAANRAPILAQCAAYRLANQERIRQQRTTYIRRRPRISELSEADASRIRERERARYAANREGNLARVRAYQAAHPEVGKAAKRNRRARKKGAAMLGPVDWQGIRDRDRNICWLCKKAIPDKELSFDHAVALYKGGEHSTRNIRASHLLCNIKKHTSDVDHQRLLF